MAQAADERAGNEPPTRVRQALSAAVMQVYVPNALLPVITISGVLLGTFKDPGTNEAVAVTLSPNLPYDPLKDLQLGNGVAVANARQASPFGVLGRLILFMTKSSYSEGLP